MNSLRSYLSFNNLILFVVYQNCCDKRFQFSHIIFSLQFTLKVLYRLINLYGLGHITLTKRFIYEQLGSLNMNLLFIEIRGVNIIIYSEFTVRRVYNELKCVSDNYVLLLLLFTTYKYSLKQS